MSDDKSQRGPRDKSRISPAEDYERRYWTKELGCTEDALRLAVQTIDNGAATVRGYFASPSRIAPDPVACRQPANEGARHP